MNDMTEWNYPLCARCGNDLPRGFARGDWCPDCNDVEGIPQPPVMIAVRGTGGQSGYDVKSSRKGAAIDHEERESLLAEVRRLTELNYSANQIALTIKVSSRTVGRYRGILSRRPEGLTVPPKNAREYVRNPDDLTKGHFRPGNEFHRTPTNMDSDAVFGRSPRREKAAV